MSLPLPTHDTRLAKVLRTVSSSFGWCLRCGWPWNFVESHSTRYSDWQSCFPLCENCWKELEVPEARIEYYKMLVDGWGITSEEEQRQIRQAVANGG